MRRGRRAASRSPSSTGVGSRAETAISPARRLNELMQDRDTLVRNTMLAQKVGYRASRYPLQVFQVGHFWSNCPTTTVSTVENQSST